MAQEVQKKLRRKPYSHKPFAVMTQQTTDFYCAIQSAADDICMASKSTSTLEPLVRQKTPLVSRAVRFECEALPSIEPLR